MSLFRAGPDAIPELALARRRRWRWALGILLLVVLAVVSSRPLYHWGKAWRSRGLAADAEKLITAQKWSEAANAAHSAYQLAPSEPAALRAVARLYSRAGVPAAGGYWKALLASSAATLDDRREAAAVALQTQQPSLAEEQITFLLNAEPNHPTTLELATRLAIAKNDRNAALEFTQRLLAQNPERPSAELLRARLLFSSAIPSQREEGHTALQHMAASATNENALPALLILASDPALTPEAAESIATSLDQHPAATPEHQLAAVALRLRFHPSERARLVEGAITRFRGHGPETTLALSRWLGQQGETARILDLITPAEASTRQDLFLVRLDALAAGRRWAEIQSVLEQEKVPLEPLHREIFLARASAELGEARGAEAHWGRAFQAAARPESVYYLAQYASKIGQTAVAEKAWRQLTRQPAFALQANLALLPLLEGQGNTRALRDVVRQIARLAPTDPAPRNDAAYLDLLLGENLASAQAIAEQLVRDHPDRLAYRTTLALAHLRAGRPQAAASVYDRLEVPWEKSAPSARAVRVAVLAANNAESEAKVLASGLPKTGLKIEEQALILPLH